MADFTNVFCRSGGSNLNAGTVDGSTTEPATTPLVTYTGGDWDSGTNTFTAAVGADMTEAQVGRFMTVYHDGDTAPTTNQFSWGRISSVNAGARTITILVQVSKGTEVASGTGNRSARIGGALAGPSGSTDLWPLDGTNLGGLTTSSSDTPAIHFKNDQTYSVTAALTLAGTSVQLWGYTSTAFDGGTAVIDGGTSGNAYNLLRLLSNFNEIHDFTVQNNGGSLGNATRVLGLEAGGQHAENVTVSGARGYGFYASSNLDSFVGCEAYDCNLSNTANHGAFTVAGGQSHFHRCIAGNSAGGTNSSGWVIAGTGAVLTHCVAHNNAGHGFHVGSSSRVNLVNCDAYANDGSGVFVGSANNYLENCNLVANGEYGIGGTSTVLLVHTRNCGYGSGTMANVSGNTQTPAQVIDDGSFSYDADVTPWDDPDNGVFDVTLAAAVGAGVGTFRQTETGQGPTTGHPDIGAAQSESGSSSGSSGGGIRLAGHGGLVA